MFQKGENTDVDKTNWKPGDYQIEDKGRISWVRILSLEDPRPKTLDEARGPAVSDYQNYLEKEWVDKLRKENPVSYNEAEVAKLIKK
jgi:peptidyl-prolyl cis-trans isomerase SurA